MLEAFEFDYKVDKEDIELVKVAEKIASKVKNIDSNYKEFTVAHKINTFSHREEIALKNKQENASNI